MISGALLGGVIGSTTGWVFVRFSAIGVTTRTTKTAAQ